MKPFTIQGGAVRATGVGAAVAGNTGNGTITAAPATGTGAKAGVYRAVCTAAAANSGTFAVYDPDGILLGSATVATPFTTHLTFTIADGAADFIVGDAFEITVYAQLAPGSVIKATENASVRIPVSGIRDLRVQAKITGGTGTLSVTRYRPDGTTASTVGNPTDVALADGVENKLDGTDLIGDEYVLVKITAGGADVTVGFVDIYGAGE
jgi:hypothetical protein